MKNDNKKVSLVGIGLLAALIMVNVQSTQQQIQKKVTQQELKKKELRKKKTKCPKQKQHIPLEYSQSEKIKSTPVKVEPTSGLNFDSQKNKRIITVHNGITKDMIAYHRFGKHVPTFELTINGQKLNEGDSLKIETGRNNVDVHYKYSFGSYKEGEETISCAIDPKKNECTLNFLWKKKPHVILK
ncbi:hypothetical protein HRU45_04365 [Candidatus Dependentiae bacterium]|nr:hypothetical protein [Candidatus Dependentiae bacterium]